MRIRIIFAFIFTIFIPTFFLAYFGLLAVRSDKSTVEKNMNQRYQAIADIVSREIQSALHQTPPEMLRHPESIERVIQKASSIFRNDVMVLDREGRVVAGTQARDPAQIVLLVPVEGLAYDIAVYERHPVSLATLEAKKEKIFLYIVLIVVAAILILIGGSSTFWALSREWHLARLKTEFVSHLSHDLRKPLTSVRMFSEMLKENRVPDEDKKKEYYDIISNESEKLLHLANNILDFARIESGRVKHHFQHEDIVQLVTETVERFKGYAVEKDQSVTLHVRDVFPLVKLDAQSVSQALINLLSNAVQYGPFNKEIKVNLMKCKNKVVIEVADQGKGIPKAEQKKIFKRFYRVSREGEGQLEGSGLGLTLVKFTAQIHKGTVTLESEEGKGTRFFLILPI